MDYNYTVKKYLDQLNNGYSTEELSSYSAGTNGSRSGPSCWSDQNSSAENSDQLIPTRQQLKFASQVAHNPLQFVSAQTGATALCEQAKQQLIISDQQKRLREEIRKKMYTDEDEADWKTNLDSWLSKRKMAISRWKNDMQHAANDSDRNRECDVAQSQVFEQQQQKQQQKQQQQKRQQRQQEHRSRNDSIIDPKKVNELLL
uniref:DUF4757 domain-containing protein n=1 Tax=Setaria digitata TaxID=48799 RepID=A0A915PXN3_9BILA